MLIKQGFPQHHHFSIMSVVVREAGPDETGCSFAPYPHLWISLWITESFSSKGFRAVTKIYASKFNVLREEASCG